jgi:hypothetical protein
MKDRGMIFNAEMVRALLNGNKTQTRRPLKNQPIIDMPLSKGPMIRIGSAKYESFNPMRMIRRCPFGQVGDRIWVRETWMPDAPRNGEWPDYEFYGGGMRPLSLIPNEYRNHHNCIYRASWDDELTGWKPSIHMPRWASRITLEITDVRVERLQDISASDAISEGLTHIDYEGDSWGFSGGNPTGYGSATGAYQALWNSLYGNWNDNPWVWAIRFKKVEV